MPIKYYKRPPLKTHTYIFFEEVRQKVIIYNVVTIGFYPSSVNSLGASELKIYNVFQAVKRQYFTNN